MAGMFTDQQDGSGESELSSALYDLQDGNGEQTASAVFVNLQDGNGEVKVWPTKLEIDDFEGAWANESAWDAGSSEFTSQTSHVLSGSEGIRTTDNQSASNTASYSGLPNYPGYGKKFSFFAYIDSNAGAGDVNHLFRIAEDSGTAAGWVDTFVVNSITNPETRFRREDSGGTAKTIDTFAGTPPFDTWVEQRWWWDDGTLGKGGDNVHTVEMYDIGANGDASPTLVGSLTLTLNDLQTRESVRIWISSNLDTVDRMHFDDLHVHG